MTTYTIFQQLISKVENTFKNEVMQGEEDHHLLDLSDIMESRKLIVFGSLPD